MLTRDPRSAVSAGGGGGGALGGGGGLTSATGFETVVDLVAETSTAYPH